MGTRDLLFVGLVLGGAAALGASLYPRRLPDRVERARDVSIADPSAREVVARVDEAFRREWDEAGLTPAPTAPELAVIRRVSLALTGTIPSLEEIRLLERVPEGSRVATWVESLLADRRCADYLAERLARAYVGTEGGPFLVYRRRRFVTWLSDQLHANRPYDQIVRELIASDGIWTDKPATNFITVTYDPERKVVDPDRLAGRVSRAFLGARIDCARCHDHPFAPWKQADFQGLAAFLGQAESGLTGIHEGDAEYRPIDRKTGKEHTVEPRVPFRRELLPAAGNRRQRLAAWVTDPRNSALPRATVNRAWAWMFGRPLVEPVDNLDNVDEAPRSLVLLADDFATHGFDLRRLLRQIAATRVFHLDSAANPEPSEDAEDAWAVFPLTPLRAEQVVSSVVQSGTLKTIDGESPILVRLGKFFGEIEFVKRYGDAGEEEFDGHCGTIPQRLLLMNGELVRDRTKPDLFNASSRIASHAPTDRRAIEIAYWTVLSRLPTPVELAHFEPRLGGTTGDRRAELVSDLFWTLINSTEFSWNH